MTATAQISVARINSVALHPPGALAQRLGRRQHALRMQGHAVDAGDGDLGGGGHGVSPVLIAVGAFHTRISD